MTRRNKFLPNSYYYLAHPTKSSKEIRKWELKIEDKFNISLVNPFFEGQYPEKLEIEKIYKESGYNKITKEQAEWIVINDIELIKNSYGVIAIIDGNISYGTIIEIRIAHENNKRIFLICTNGQENHAWLKFHATKIFTSFREFENYIEINGL